MGRAQVIARLTQSGSAAASVPLLPWDKLAFPSVEHVLHSVACAWWGVEEDGLTSVAGRTSTTASSLPRTIDDLVSGAWDGGYIPLHEMSITAVPNWEKGGAGAGAGAGEPKGKGKV